MSGVPSPMSPGGRGGERDRKRCGSWGDGNDGREPLAEVEEDEVDDDEGEEEARRTWEGGMEEDTRRRVIEL